MKENIEVGQIVTLDKNKEYIILNVLDIHSIRYVCLLSNFKPLEIIISVVKIVNGSIVFEEVNSNDELDYVLSRIALTKDEGEFD